MINIIKKKYFKNKRGTALAIGPVSKNTIIAANLASKEKNVPLMLISSRRQIETKKISKGYVDNLTTENYSNFVKKFKNNRLILCRDHGGPYQGSDEKKLNKKMAMKQAKTSLMADIDNNFKVLHIDPSVSRDKKPIPKKKIIEDIIELIDYCHQYGQQKKKKFFFEIGTEEPSPFTGSVDELRDLIDEIMIKLDVNNLPKPLFCVFQTGTRVKELMNVGKLNNLDYLEKNSINIKKISLICKKNKLLFKQHNTDYLDHKVLRTLPKLDIDAANVAPEFGYVESLAIFNILKKYNQNKLLEQFLELSYNSKKWEKWLKKNSKLTDLEKSLLAGHYIFGTKNFKELKNKMINSLSKNIELDQYLIHHVKERILYYMKCFNYY